MDASQLLARAISYGADKKGIDERLSGDAELFKLCFLSMLKEKSVDGLRKAMEAEDYHQAFLCAHSLKGMSGNLGLTPFYAVVNVLVEDLRQGKYSHVHEEYQEVQRQLAVLESLQSDGE